MISGRVLSDPNTTRPAAIPTDNAFIMPHGSGFLFNLDEMRTLPNHPTTHSSKLFRPVSLMWTHIVNVELVR
jgi:hypothetical protein